jgi:hypothetical protein
MRASDFAGKLRDTVTERELAKKLRALPEEDRFTFILEMLDVNLLVALELANACLRRKDLLARLLEHGLAQVRDLSTIKYWLEHLMPRLGVRRVIGLLRAQLDAHPFGVGSALYHLLGYVNKDDTVAVDAFRELCHEASRKGLRLPDLRGLFDTVG